MMQSIPQMVKLKNLIVNWKSSRDFACRPNLCGRIVPRLLYHSGLTFVQKLTSLILTPIYFTREVYNLTPPDTHDPIAGKGQGVHLQDIMPHLPRRKENTDLQ